VVDVSEGDVVVALTEAGLASRVITDARVAVPLPPSISRAEGAGLPVAFLTAHYALRAIARLAADQRVLIHAATGGVGLAAVHLARRIGAQVYATAGSERKRAHLRAMGVEHVFDSRSTSFGADVLRATDSAGVNLVLNSLTGEFIATGLSVVSRDGVFVEIGKRGIWSSQEVAAVRPDVRYEIFDLAAFRRENPEAVGRALRAIVGEVERGELSALPTTVFAASAADDAFRFMQQARQIGKVVVAQPLPAQLDAAATYLISGGFGALGLASARWLVEHGARHLVLFSRSGPDAAAREKIQALERLGAVVIARRGDVSKREDVASIIDLVRGTLPPLRGVIHTAGILDDGLMVDENADRFERVMAPKVAGARHLDALTRALPLDFFVLFSSGSWLLGTPGQGAYAAANAYLDVLARERRRRGLPATTVNWGAWRGDGMAATLDAQSRERRAKLGYGEIASSTALDVLGRLLRIGETSAAVLPMDWPRFVSSLRDDQRDFFEELVTRAPAMAAEETAPSELARRVREAPSNARAAMVEDALAHTLRSVLGFRDARSLSPERPLRELGLDSLMAMEFTARLGEVTSLRLSPTVTFNHPNLRDLAEHVIERLVDSEPSTPETPDDALEGPADADAAALEDRIARLERLLDADL
jgi:NADPH:quinone reductase-like Zn-dependent oxidoreductase/acyl carrier protein